MTHVLNVEPCNLIDIRDLCVETANGDEKLILDDINLRVRKGSVLGIVGESGSGKSTLALTMLGHLKPGLRHVSGHVLVNECDTLLASQTKLSELRRRVVAYVPQNAGLSLTPTKRIGSLIGEVLQIGGEKSAKQIKARVIELLKAVRLANAEEIATRYPYQLSGGQQQRCAIAMAIASSAELLILDEPTSALDATTHNELLALLRTLMEERSLTLVCVTHDMRVVSRLCSDIAVMHQGKLVEQGNTDWILRKPQHPYTQKLLKAQPSWRGQQGTQSQSAQNRGGGSTKTLDIRDLAVSYSRGSILPKLWPLSRCAVASPAIQDITFSVQAGKIVGVIGESGSGKSTLLRAVAGASSIQNGQILLAETQDLARLGSRSMDLRRKIQLVWQNPLAALNPRQTVFEAIDAPLRLYFDLSTAQRRIRAGELLGLVQLTPDFLHRLPGELSGGQAQRVAIARACAAEPDIMLCDEITSALDISVQAAVLDVIMGIRAHTGCTFLFVSHDLAVVASIADEVIVLHNGHICEAGATEQVLATPKHPYTRSLIEAFGHMPEMEVQSRADTDGNRRPVGSHA
ncbi:ABC transporter ATP-binding protein [Rhizobium mongolense]|uniref:Peptide/nickel transport system ATP-binding protein n=2 Tax=Rhizobium mongolense TaxID=57676 RepID=A0ABR6IX85_9HYPH|nr:ABC transporter ATP-binding protein [Rhizobium mongolense]MBB4232536.1 peptide/nickel transport system ATP-binding protein [Rhizobium mongolense]TVZ75025.1 peptide/nickel transport system ATP-binding protein [Rhizobium mongolense USDA 1844]